jgi:L-aspartate oxidase
LLVDEGAVTGVVACDREQRRQVRIFARAVLLATGGLGRVFKETTNPDVATGDGIATAFRAGAVISDVEFVQFHPTALFVSGAPRFLLTEALRGEGGRLLNDGGERFMHRYDERGELAPRDIVSRSILAEMRRTRLHVYLDLTHMDPAFVRRRFPRVYDTCLRHGVDITAGPVPVHPAAHYAMGGVRSDINGLTNVERLFAAGEVACSGVHGANRLASNSLLEGLVFGARAGQAMRESAPSSKRGGEIPEPERYPEMSESQVRDIAWEHCGVLRDAAGLTEATRLLGSVPLERVARPAREHYELRNLHAVATLIARCALAREESRGAHYRTDFPDTLEQFQKHSHVDKRSEVRFE